MDEQNGRVARLIETKSDWLIEGEDFLVSIRRPQSPNGRWHLLVECGEPVDHLSEDGRVMACRQVSRYAIGDGLADLVPALSSLNSDNHRQALELLATIESETSGIYNEVAA